MRRFAVAVVVGLCAALSAQPAYAAETNPPSAGTDCEHGTVRGVCNIEIGTGNGETAPVDNPGGGDRGGGAGERTCIFGGHEIDCTSPFGVWNGQCYVREADPQPPFDDPVWGGRTEGVIVVCMPFVCVPQAGQDTIPEEDCPGRAIIWASAVPGVGALDPEVLAQQAVTQMNLSAITVGIVPEAAPGRVGLVGMPVWMWADNPAENTVGPITRSASAGGFTVTATASVDRTVWDMGDGTTVTCTGPGTPYEDRFGTRPSPDCGHQYTRQGDYTVSARSYWTVRWEGAGQSGTIPLDFTRDAQITVGEAQVITQ